MWPALWSDWVKRQPFSTVVPREEMPAFEEEIAEALEEGVKIRYLVNPIRIHQKDGLKRLECLRMALGEKDESGRRRPVPIPNSNFFIEVENVIIAAGEEIRILLPSQREWKSERGSFSPRETEAPG